MPGVRDAFKAVLPTFCFVKKKSVLDKAEENVKNCY